MSRYLLLPELLNIVLERNTMAFQPSSNHHHRHLLCQINCILDDPACLSIESRRHRSMHSLVIMIFMSAIPRLSHHHHALLEVKVQAIVSRT